MALVFPAAGAFSAPALNGYWGQGRGSGLKSYCDSGIEYVTLSFVNLAPENDKSENMYPGINFAGNCQAETFKGSRLLSNCQSIKEAIPYCQERGVKVLLSIGGEFSPSNNYKVSSDANGEYFADFLYNAFGKGRKQNVPRPFDYGGQQVAVDGFDFDIEKDLPNGPYIAMINKLRALDSSVLITGAPQCPTSPHIYFMKEMIEKAAFDALFIQFYNNPVCNANGNGFNLQEWSNLMARTDKNKGTKLFIGLPAARDAAGEGSYADLNRVKELVCRYKNELKANFGGVSLWDLDRSNANIIDGKPFHAHILELLRNGCGDGPATTLPTKTTSTGKPDSTSSTKNPFLPKPNNKNPFLDNLPKNPLKTPNSESSTENPSLTKPNSESSTGNPFLRKPNSESSTGNPSLRKPNSESSTGNPFLKKPNPEDASTVDQSTSTTAPGSSQLPGSEVAPTVGLSTSGMKWSNSTATPAIKPGSLNPETAYTTRVYTISSCPPEVIDCPLTYKTEVVPLHTTENPAGQTAQPTATETSAPLTTEPAVLGSVPMTTSTVYTTTPRTITSCPMEVTDCPLGKVVMVTISLYTTVCPVTESEMETPAVPMPTSGSTGEIVTEVPGSDEDACPADEAEMEKTPAAPMPTSGATGEGVAKVPESDEDACPADEAEMDAKVPSPRESASVSGSSTLETLTKSASETPVNPAPGVVGQPATFTTAAVPGPNTQASPRKGLAAEAPMVRTGCSGPSCKAGVAAATGRLSAGFGRPPLEAVQAGASGLAVSLTGLFVVMVLQLLAL